MWYFLLLLKTNPTFCPWHSSRVTTVVPKCCGEGLKICSVCRSQPRSFYSHHHGITVLALETAALELRATLGRTSGSSGCFGNDLNFSGLWFNEFLIVLLMSIDQLSLGSKSHFFLRDVCHCEIFKTVCWVDVYLCRHTKCFSGNNNIQFEHVACAHWFTKHF